MPTSTAPRRDRRALEQPPGEFQIGGVERLEQHEQAMLGGGAPAARAIRLRGSMRRIISTPPAPAARASST